MEFQDQSLPMFISKNDRKTGEVYPGNVINHFMKLNWSEYILLVRTLSHNLTARRTGILTLFYSEERGMNSVIG